MLQCNSIKGDRSVRAALYARVSSDQQASAGTIQSQIDAILSRAAQDQLTIDPELRFIDDGVSGATLIRAALEKLRDSAAAGAIDRLYVLCPDRLSRTYAHQMVLIDELMRCGVELVFVNHQLDKTPEGHLLLQVQFVNHELSESPEDHLLLQMQGMIAEYERAKILERSRRGKLHGARTGKLSVIGSAPYGYRYMSGEGGGAAQYSVHLPEASIVKEIFQRVGMERMSLRQVCRTLEKRGILSPRGMSRWSAATVKAMLANPAYKGVAAYGKTCRGPMRRRLRPIRGSSVQMFSSQVAAGLDQADWQTRRNIITTLVKRVELQKEQVKIVYRVDLSPFYRRPETGDLEHCKAREFATVFPLIAPLSHEIIVLRLKEL